MLPPTAHDIFLSYAREDRERARAFADRLEERGWSVWWDRDMPQGRSFADVTTEALEAAQCVVVLWSRASASSKWVQEEAARGRERRALFPVLIDEVEIPPGFGETQTATLTDWDGSPSHPQLRSVLSQLEVFLGSAGSAALAGSTKQSASAGSTKQGASAEATSEGVYASQSSFEAPREKVDDGPTPEPNAEPDQGALSRFARVLPGAVVLLALAAWGISALLASVRSVNVRLSFAPAVHWAVTPAGSEAGEAAARSGSLAGLGGSGLLGDLAQRGPHRLDAFFLVVEDVESGDTLAVVESFREDVLLLGADTAAAVSRLERADSASASLRALLDGGGLAGAPSGYIREADADGLTQRSVEVSRAVMSGTPIRLTLVRVDWGGGEAVAVATVRPETDCREATGGGGFLGRGRLYDCFVFGGPAYGSPVYAIIVGACSPNQNPSVRPAILEMTRTEHVEWRETSGRASAWTITPKDPANWPFAALVQGNPTTPAVTAAPAPSAPAGVVFSYNVTLTCQDGSTQVIDPEIIIREN